MLVAPYKHKKDLKASVGKPLRYEETSMFGAEYKSTGTFAVVGSGAYKRDWFATVTMKDDIIVKVT
jgi:hypothetical protein